MAYPSRIRKVTVKGIVLPSEWDEKGTIVGLKLFTHDEDEYQVEGNEMLRELLDYLREELLVTGYFQGEQNRKIIQITEFYLINDL